MIWTIAYLYVLGIILSAGGWLYAEAQRTGYLTLGVIVSTILFSFVWPFTTLPMFVSWVCQNDLIVWRNKKDE